MNNAARIKMYEIIIAVLLSAPIVNRVRKLVSKQCKDLGEPETLALMTKMNKVPNSAVQKFLLKGGHSNRVAETANMAELQLAYTQNMINIQNKQNNRKRKNQLYDIAVEVFVWSVLAVIGHLLFSQLKDILTFKALQEMLQKILDKLIAESKTKSGYMAKTWYFVTSSNPKATFLIRLVNIILQVVTAVSGFGVDLGKVIYYLIMFTAILVRKLTHGRKFSIGFSGFSIENTHKPSSSKRSKISSRLTILPKSRSRGSNSNSRGS